MSLKTWSVKQVLFERDLNMPNEFIWFNGFKMPKDKEFILDVLEELYKLLGRDEYRKDNVRKLEELSKNGTKFFEIRVDDCRDAIVYTMGPTYYPDLFQYELIYCPFGQRFRNLKGYNIHRQHLTI